MRLRLKTDNHLSEMLSPHFWQLLLHTNSQLKLIMLIIHACDCLFFKSYNLLQLVVLLLDQLVYTRVTWLLLLFKECSFSIYGCTVPNVINFGAQMLQGFSLTIDLVLSYLTLFIVFVELEKLSSLFLELRYLGRVLLFNLAELVILFLQQDLTSFALL